MLANNETGAIQPVARLAELAMERGLPTHTDAVQAVGRIRVDFKRLGVATLTASAHKFHGPAGVGVLLVRKGITLRPHTFGGAQQGGRRPGTQPVALAVGLAKALEQWRRGEEARVRRWRHLRDSLEQRLIGRLGQASVVRNGPSQEEARLPQTLNLAFPGVDGDALLIHLDLSGLAVSLGSACSSGTTKPSSTLVAMQVPRDRLRSSVRLSLGAFTSEAEIDQAVEFISTAVVRIRDSADSENAWTASRPSTRPFL
jgi:cysteine desulfurase